MDTQLQQQHLRFVVPMFCCLQNVSYVDVDIKSKNKNKNKKYVNEVLITS